MDGLPNINVYVDESGTNTLGSLCQNDSHLFICVAVLVEDSDLQSLNNSIIAIQKKHFSGSELKSSNVGKKIERRIKVLKEISVLPFRFYALIINKNKLDAKSPLQYKKTFYKYIHKMLYQKLTSKGACCLKVKADRIGSVDFMESFKTYLEDKGKPDLLSAWDHSFVDSKDEPIIQVADFIAGSLCYCYDCNKQCQKSSEINNILCAQCSGIDVWPYGIIEIPDTLPLDMEEINRRLEALLNNKIVNYIIRNEDSEDIDMQMQAFVLRELYATREYDDSSKKSIYSDELIKRLHFSGYEELNKQNFTARIIGKLRDNGIILCGSPLGYRLALSIEDINDYIEHDRSIIEPMLWRLQHARENIKGITPLAYDILNLARFDNLRSIVDVHAKNRIITSTAKDIEPSDEEIE